MMPSYLTLGWQVNASGDPRFWLSGKAKAGAQEVGDLVRVPASALAAHTAIIAQSGSGKSFFLGRLIEEILTGTKARCVILDPNGDFSQVHHVQPPELWKQAAYDSPERSGWLPHETSRETFESAWSKVSIRIKKNEFFQESDLPYEAVQLWWPSLSADFLAEDADPRLRSELYHCHAFVRAIGRLCTFKFLVDEKPIRLIDVAAKLYRQYRDRSIEAPPDRRLAMALDEEFNVQELARARSAQLKAQKAKGPTGEAALKRRLASWFRQAAAALEYVSADVGRYYFAKAKEYQAAGIVASQPPGQIAKDVRLQVLDLSSFSDRNTRLLAINALVSTEWDRARNAWSDALEGEPGADERVPTFIVLDEAHNLVPGEVRGKGEEVLREQFRTIIAEGRKFGLFLIVVSQRPDKIDPLVISECENRALMKLNSMNVLKITQERLSLEDVSSRTLEKCLEFGRGRALLMGSWVPDGPQFLYSAARRTVEGGRNLRAGFWASRPDDNG